MSLQEYNWWDFDDTEADEVHLNVFSYVQEVERQQAYLFDRFYKLNCLYDPYFEHISGYGSWYDQFGTDYNVTENVVAASVDTVVGIVASTRIRARMIPTDGDFKTQRIAKHLEWYAEGLGKRYKMHEKGVEAFKNAALKGTGLVRVDIEHVGEKRQLRVEHVPIDDIVVDEIEARHGEPSQMHQRMFYSVDELIARFPDFEEEISKAAGGGNIDGGRYWADYRPFQDDQVVVIESWYLGRRHSITIENVTLFDEAYDKDYFPFAVIRWSKRPSGWYGIGGAERIAGHQRVINKTNWQIDRQLDQLAVPTVFCDFVDAKLAVQSVSRAGTVVPIKGNLPKTVIPQAVSAETYQRLDDVKSSAFEEFGVSRMAATAKKPAGIESGAALREYRDATTERFRPQEAGFEALQLRIVWLAIAACKELGDEAPTIVREVYGGKRTLMWSDVDMDEVEYNLAAASNLARTPAGKRQLVLELAQSGVVSKDSAAKLMELEDVDGELSFYTAGIKSLDMMIEAILDGKDDIVPTSSHPLSLGIWRFQMAELNAEMAGADEDRLEALREWRDRAAFILNPPPPPPGAVDPTLPPVDPLAMDPNAPIDPMAQSMPSPSAMTAGPPMEQPPAALAPMATQQVI